MDGIAFEIRDKIHLRQKVYFLHQLVLSQKVTNNTPTATKFKTTLSWDVFITGFKTCAVHIFNSHTNIK